MQLTKGCRTMKNDKEITGRFHGLVFCVYTKSNSTNCDINFTVIYITFDFIVIYISHLENKISSPIVYETVTV